MSEYQIYIIRPDKKPKQIPINMSYDEAQAYVRKLVAQDEKLELANRSYEIREVKK